MAGHQPFDGFVRVEESRSVEQKRQACDDDREGEASVRNGV
jgi:hypothetical protein